MFAGSQDTAAPMIMKAAAEFRNFISPQVGSSGLQVAGLMVGCLM